MLSGHTVDKKFTKFFLKKEPYPWRPQILEFIRLLSSNALDSFATFFVKMVKGLTLVLGLGTFRVEGGGIRCGHSFTVLYSLFARYIY